MCRRTSTIRGDDRTPDKSKAMVPGIPETLGVRFPDVAAVTLPLSAYAPDKREFVIKETIAASQANVVKARAALAAARKTVADAAAVALNPEPLSATLGGFALQRLFDALAVAEADAMLAETRHAALLATIQAEQLEDAGKKDSPEWKDAATAATIAQRKQAVAEARRNLLAAQQTHRAGAPASRPELAKKVDAAEKALAQAEANEKQPATTAYTKRPIKMYPATSTGRRLAFARWIAEPR